MLLWRAMDHDTIITEQIIGCAIEVHRDLGPGLLESPYHAALCVELAHRGITFERQRIIPLEYRGAKIGDYIPDLIVENTVVVEIKSVDRFEPVHVAQVLTYIKATGKRLGLLINFNVPVLKDGIRRVVL